MFRSSSSMSDSMSLTSEVWPESSLPCLSPLSSPSPVFEPRPPLTEISNAEGYTQDARRASKVGNSSKGDIKMEDGSVAIRPVSVTFRPRARRAASTNGEPAGQICRAAPAQSAPFAEPGAEYSGDILCTLLCRERVYMPAPDCFQRQRDLTPAMRPILNDWLADLSQDFGFRRETRFAAVNIVDRYLSRVQVSRHGLQLIGAAAMLIAAKFEEMHPPSLNKLAYLMAGEFSEQEIMLAECSVLSGLGFEVSCPTAAHFLPHFVGARGGRRGSLTSRDVCLAWQILDGSLLDSCSHCFRPSILALSALFVARSVSDPVWAGSPAHVFADFIANNNLHIVSGVDAELELCAQELWRVYNAGARRPLKAAIRQRAQRGASGGA